MEAAVCKHDYRIRLGFNTGMHICCKRCEQRFVPKWWLTLLVVVLPLATVCGYAMFSARAQGMTALAWLGMPLLLGGVTWELLQGVLCILCAVAKRFGKLDRLVEEKA